MGSLFRLKIVRYLMSESRVLADRDGAERVNAASPPWYGKYRGHAGKEVQVRLSPAGVRRCGCWPTWRRRSSDARRASSRPPPTSRPCPSPLHLSDYVRHVRPGRTTEYVRLQENRIRRVLDGIEAKRLANLDPSRVAKWLADRHRTDKRFESSPARRYVVVLRGFSLWMVGQDRVGKDPFAGLKKRHVGSKEKRHGRRTLAASDFSRLRATTRGSMRTDGGRTAGWCLARDDRFRLYISSNEVPRFVEPSGALAARMPILRLDRSFAGREDRKSKNRLESELPGILNWSLAGRARLRSRRDLTSSEKEAEQLND